MQKRSFLHPPADSAAFAKNCSHWITVNPRALEYGYPLLDRVHTEVDFKNSEHVSKFVENAKYEGYWEDQG